MWGIDIGGTIIFINILSIFKNATPYECNSSKSLFILSIRTSVLVWVIMSSLIHEDFYSTKIYRTRLFYRKPLSIIWRFWFLMNFLRKINIKYKDFMFIDANLFFMIVSNWFKTRYPYWQIARSMEYTPLQSNALRILLHSLSLNQSTSVLKNMFATQRALVTRVSQHCQNTENRHSGHVINASLVVD